MEGFFSNGIVQSVVAALTIAICAASIWLVWAKLLRKPWSAEVGSLTAIALAVVVLALIYWNVDITNLLDTTTPAQGDRIVIYVARIDGDNSRNDIRRSIIDSLRPEFTTTAEVLQAALEITPDLGKSESDRFTAMADQGRAFLREHKGDILIWGRTDQLDGKSVPALNLIGLNTSDYDSVRSQLDDVHLINTNSIVIKIFFALLFENTVRLEENDVQAYQDFVKKLEPIADSPPQGLEGDPAAALDTIVGEAHREQWKPGEPLDKLKSALAAYQAAQGQFAGIHSNNQFFAIMPQLEIMRWIYLPTGAGLDDAFVLAEKAKSFIPHPDDGRSAMLELQIGNLYAVKATKRMPHGQFTIYPFSDDMKTALTHYEAAKRIAASFHNFDSHLVSVDMATIINAAENGIRKIYKMQSDEAAQDHSSPQ